MSILSRDHADPAGSAAHADGELEEAVVAVRRNVLLSGVVGAAALVVGVAFLLRGSSAFDGLFGLLLLAVAGLQVPALAASRVPVLVADDQGIRLRIGLTWRGLRWSAIRQVVVEESDAPLREGRLVVVPRDARATLHRLDALARLHLRWNQTWYGAGLSVPLGMTTVVDSPDLAADLAALADGRVEVVHLRGTELSRLDDVTVVADPGPAAAEPTSDYAAPGQPIPYEDPEFTEHVVVHEPEPEPEPEPETILPPPVQPLRDLHQPQRVDVRLDPPAEPVEPVEPAREDSLGPSWDDLPVEVVIDDLADVRPLTDPVIGPKITHARECLDMTVEELSQRTRIRPHVLEAIEQDDFAPCGGDFYARGHLTAISRALGLTLDPLLKSYDELYSQAPINARRVFEAELSSGLSGGMRATLSGPRWSLLVGSVLCLTMVWGLARIFAGDPEQLTTAPESAQTAGLSANHAPITSPKMRTTTVLVTARYAGTHAVVKDRTGKILWSGDLALGKKRKIVGLAPFTVSADNAGAVDVIIKDKNLGDLGTAGQPGSKKFGSDKAAE